MVTMTMPIPLNDGWFDDAHDRARVSSGSVDRFSCAGSVRPMTSWRKLTGTNRDSACAVEFELGNTHWPIPL